MVNIEDLKKEYIKIIAMLQNKFNGRVDIDYSTLYIGILGGTLDSKRFTITYLKDEMLLASSERDVLNELFDILKTIVNGEEPLCIYEIKTKGNDDNSVTTIEWYFVEPENRIKDIVNGVAYPNFDVFNLRLYNGKKTEDYLYTEEEKKEIENNARIYGIDPGFIADTDIVNDFDELDLFLEIDALNYQIWETKQKMARKLIPEVDLTESQYTLEYLAYQTRKFGVDIPEAEINKHVEATESYKKWFNFYSHHFKEVLTDEEYEEFIRVKKCGGDVSRFMPKGKWNDDENKQVLKNVMNNDNNKRD